MTTPLLEIDNLKVAYGRDRGRPRRRPRGGRGRVRGDHRRQRRGQDVHPAGDCRCGGAGRGAINFDGRATGGQPSHVMVARGIAMVPEGRQVFADQTVHDNLLLGAYVRSAATAPASRRHGPRAHPLSAPQRAADPAGRLPLRRRAADARHRAGTPVAAEAPGGRRALARPRPQDARRSSSRSSST